MTILASIAGLALILMMVTIVRLFSGAGEYRDVKLESYEEAEEYIQKGWIPESIPKTAEQITVVYRLDENPFLPVLSHPNLCPVLPGNCTWKKIEETKRKNNADFPHRKTGVKKEVAIRHSILYSSFFFLLSKTGT